MTSIVQQGAVHLFFLIMFVFVLIFVIICWFISQLTVECATFTAYVLILCNFFEALKDDEKGEGMDRQPDDELLYLLACLSL